MKTKGALLTAILAGTAISFAGGSLMARESMTAIYCRMQVKLHYAIDRSLCSANIFQRIVMIKNKLCPSGNEQTVIA